MPMHAKTLPGLTAMAVLLATIPAHARDSGDPARPRIGTPPIMQAAEREDARWVAAADGRWHAGARAPGGWAAYQRPYRGYALPDYWRQPSFQISDHARDALPAPASGLRWSRYYDDAVLTDSLGRVVDMRIGHDWSGAHGNGSSGSGALLDPARAPIIAIARYQPERSRC